MSNNPCISICIPAYKNLAFLERLLNSIAEQTFRDYEVIITDDSPDAELENYISQYQKIPSLSYYRNIPSLGTPGNWNESIRHAKGDWIKLMHDDDWFASTGSLQKLYDLTKKEEGISFVFCGSTTIENGKIVLVQELSHFQEKLLRKDPQNLFSRNNIGPPSVIMHRNDQAIWYDKRMKWLVDIDFYIRYLQHNPHFNFTKEQLINVGFSEAQVTKQVFYDKNVVIPENLLLLSKLDPKILDRLWNYDFAWRLMRNHKVRTKLELFQLHPQKEEAKIPGALFHIVSGQKRIPYSLLNIGLFSKGFMLLNYLTYHLFYRQRQK